MSVMNFKDDRCRLQLSINQSCNPELDLVEALLTYKKWGVNQVGLWRHQISRFGIEKSIELIRELDMEVTSLSWIGGFTGALGKTFQQSIIDAHQWLWIAREIKAKTLIIKTGALNGHINSHARRLVLEGIEKILRKAERLNIQLSIKPVDPLWGKEWSFLFSYEETRKLIERIQSQHLGICFNTFHLFSENLPSVDWQEFTRYVNLVQISDRTTSTNKGPLGCLPGTGEVGVFHLLEQLGFSDCACPIELHIEHGNGSVPSLDADFYRGLIRRVEEYLSDYATKPAADDFGN